MSKQEHSGSASLDHCLMYHKLIALFEIYSQEKTGYLQLWSLLQYFGSNHLVKIFFTRIKCHYCNAPHHPLLCKAGGKEHGNEEQMYLILQKLNTLATPRPTFLRIWVLLIAGFTGR